MEKGNMKKKKQTHHYYCEKCKCCFREFPLKCFQTEKVWGIDHPIDYVCSYCRAQKKITSGSLKNLEENKTFIIEYLETHPCVQCGETNILCLEFDHIDRKNKSSEVGKLLSQSKEILIAEIFKCQVLCSNCHQIKTHQEINSYRWQYIQNQKIS